MNDLEKHIVTGSYEPQTGDRCLYIPMNDEFGMKLYHECAARDASWENQDIGFEAHIGPEAMECFTVSEETTQHIFKELDSYIPTDWCGEITKLWGFVTQSVEEVPITDEELEELSNRMMENGFAARDLMCDFNVGKLDGQAVCLDFDAYTVGQM